MPSELILPRRKFLTALTGLIAAPAVIRVAKLMPIKPPEVVFEDFLYEERVIITPPMFIQRFSLPHDMWRKFNLEALRLKTSITENNQ